MRILKGNSKYVHAQMIGGTWQIPPTVNHLRIDRKPIEISPRRHILGEEKDEKQVKNFLK